MLSQNPHKSKKQATIFDLQRLKSENTKSITIDLTRDEGDIIGDKNPAILCPICSMKMSMWEMEARISHVEECLSMLTIKESELLVPSINAHLMDRDYQKNDGKQAIKTERMVSLKTIDVRFDGTDKKHKESETATYTTRNKREPTEGDVKALKNVLKKPKHKVGTTQLEKQSFINSKPQENKIKRKSKQPEKADTKDGLLPSSRKIEIPDLKLLTFTKDKSENHTIAVDAFCYKPHNYVTQYFLSHFHSDHYGGFTKRWCRERTIDKRILYCSEVTAKLLMIRYNAEPEFIFQLKTNLRYKVWCYNIGSVAQTESQESDNHGSKIVMEDGYIAEGGFQTSEQRPGLYVTSIDANHCPGATIFLFESVSVLGESSFSLHCGDFRVCKTMLEHPALRQFHAGEGGTLQSVYLDTTYMSPTYNFPLQETVCDAAATMIEKLAEKGELYNEWLGNTLQSRITDFLLFAPKVNKKKFLVLVGTYLIGKEKLAIAILQRMGSCPIYVSNINSRGDKTDILASFGNNYLDGVLTQDDIGSNYEGDVVVHLVPMKIVGTAGAISSYFNHNKYFEHFDKCIGFRPTGWAVQDSRSRFESDNRDKDLPLATMVKILKNRPSYTYMDILGQKRPQSDKSLDKPTFKIYSLPYSEHLSFRELSFFALLLNIGKIIPTVNTERDLSRAEMALIIKQWEAGRITRMNSMNGECQDTHGLGCLTLATL